ncbi:MAG: methyltransferase domain-containing protein [Pseudomonadota bacterium]
MQLFSAAPERDAAALYDRLAPDYDRLHRRWLRYAGGEAQVALEAIVRAVATPSTALLDAGCGTGTFTRALIAEGMSPAGITLLDPSGAMLARCSDIAAMKINGRLEDLPFEDGVFDIVTCAWALETVADPDMALSELCRVVRPGGMLCLAFCAALPARRVAGWMMRRAITWRGTGRFLSRERVVHALRRSGEFDVRIVPSTGPAAALLARRRPPSDRIAMPSARQARSRPGHDAGDLAAREDA